LKKDLVVVLSHADTQEKIELLEQCVDQMVLQNKKILISSHIDIPKNLYNKVDYVIYEKENSLIKTNEFVNHIVNFWTSYPFYYQDLIIESNHAFAVHKLILNSCAIAKLNEFDVVHFINYDYVIKDPSVLDKHNFTLENCELVSYNWNGHGLINDNHISSGFFSAKTNIFLDVISKIKTKEQYCKFGYPIYEEFLFHLCKDKLTAQFLPGIDILEKNIIDAKSLIDEFIIKTGNKKLKMNLAKEGEDYYLLFLFDESLDVIINGKNIQTSPIVSLYLLDYNMIKSGIDIEIPELNIKRKFSQSTIVAIAKILNRSIIKYELVGKKKYTIEEYCDENKPKRYDLINFLNKRFKFNNYLEIGVNDGYCIRRIEIPNKDGVDPQHSAETNGNFVPEINFQMTSDEFFQNHVNTKYDVIFIDGLHHSEQVDKDIINSLAHLKEGGFILLHDCNPPTYEMQIVPRQTGLWNGDVWKSIVKARKIQGLEVSVVDTDWGVGVIRRGSQQVIQYPLEQCLDWNFFDGHREEILNIISVEDFYKKYS
jgi:hypothetical protein